MKPDASAVRSGLPQPITLQPISEREYLLFQRLIYETAGIHLGPSKKELLVTRLGRRMRELEITKFSHYHRYVLEHGDSELTVLLDAICTNETRFFREPKQFEFLEEVVFPKWSSAVSSRVNGRRIRVWSAACSTGEEPYSLAMVLRESFPPEQGWEVEILATDLSSRALLRAKEPLWPIEKAREIPQRYLKPYMLRGVRSQEGKMTVGPEIRPMVRFERLNLNDEGYPVQGPFDLIFCRNVLIYFDAVSRKQVISRLLGHLASDGYLFLGHAESLSGLTDRVRPVAPTIYIPIPV